MKHLFRSGIVLLLLMTGCGTETPTRSNTITPLTSIAITADNLTIPAGTTTLLKATGDFSGFFTDDITGQVDWKSNTPDIADFKNPTTNPGRLTGLVPGVATLTATKVTAKGTVSASFNVLVNNATITKMEITPKDPSVAKGLTIDFTVLGTFSDSSTKDMTFEAKWESSDINVAAIGDLVDKKQIVKAIELGTSDITATFNGIPGTSLMTVKAPDLQSITVTTPSSSVLSLTSVSFTATGFFSDGSQNDITSQVTWSSSLPTIASPPPTGGSVAKALAQGTTSISASLDGIVSDPSFSLKVTGGNLVSIALTPAVSTLVRGTSVRMTATGTFNNGATRDITEVVEWSTSVPAIATVDTPAGNLTFLNALSTTSAQTQITVTAKSGLVSSPAANLTVTIPTLQSIAIAPPTLDLNVQTSGRLTATGTFSDGSTQDVTANATWASTSAATASVGDTGTAKGLVKGVAGGTTTITATIGSVVSTINPTVTVTARTVRDLTIGTVAVAQGSQVQFTATASYLDGSPSKDVTEVAAWSFQVDKPNVAILADKLNQPGQVVGVDTGTTVLQADFGGQTATATLSVP